MQGVFRAVDRGLFGCAEPFTFSIMFYILSVTAELLPFLGCIYGRVEYWVTHQPHKLTYVGSSPTSATKEFN